MEIKKIIKSKNVWSIFLVFTMLILLSSFVSANFGVGSPVSELLYPGQSIESALSVQNTLDDAKDLIVAGEILEGGDYVSFINDVSNIMVPAGEIVVVPIKISVPQDAKIGDIYDIKVLFKGISGGSGGEGGTIEFKFNVGKSFKVVVIPNPNDFDNDGILNADDSCADTASGEEANTQGCSCSQIEIPFRECSPSRCEGENWVEYAEGGSDICEAGVITQEYSCTALSSVYSAECDTDDDNDGVLDNEDNCPLTANPNQEDNDLDEYGDLCDTDDDNDNVLDNEDNCPLIANPLQEDNEQDGIGDLCDSDDDNDNIEDTSDNCQFISNNDQRNFDGDAMGDVCDEDDDNDGVLDESDLCANTSADKFRRLIVGGYGDIDNDGIFETRKKLFGPIINSKYSLKDSYGCSCLQILEIKPGNNLGERNFGCRKATLEVFMEKIGWARDFNK